MITKIKIGLSKREAAEIDANGVRFGFVKSNGTLNQGAFLNQLIVALWNNAKNTEQILSKNIQWVYSKNHQRPFFPIAEVTSSPFSEVPKWSRKESLDSPISFRPSAKLLDCYEEILKAAEKKASLSEYLRFLIDDYLNLPLAFRQYLVLKESHQKIAESFVFQRCLNVRKGTTKILLRPYYFGPDQSLETLILVGLSSELDEPAKLEVFDFLDIYRTCFSAAEFCEFSPDELQYLSDQPFIFKKQNSIKKTDFSCTAKLDDWAIKYIESNCLSSQFDISFDGSTYHILGAENEIFALLCLLGSHAFVVSPLTLRNAIFSHFKTAYESYDAGGLLLDF